MKTTNETTNENNAIAKLLEYRDSGVNDGNYSIVRLLLDNSETDIELFEAIVSISVDYKTVPSYISELVSSNDIVSFFSDRVEPFENFERSEKPTSLEIEKITFKQVQKIANEILEF